MTIRSRTTAAAAAALALAAAAPAQAACAPDVPQLVIYHAGSLTAAFAQVEAAFTQQTGICVVDVAAGSVDAARRVTAGREPADIYASADAKDIDLLLKPAGYADYTLTFAQGAMVLAYNTASRGAATIVAPDGVYAPPAAIPPVAPNWTEQLLQSGVVIAGSNPFLDPSGYRTDLIFQLAERRSGVPNLYDTLLGHYTLTRAGDALGRNFDYQFTYEHSAYAAYLANPASYRYARLPAEIGLSDPALNARYAEAGIVIPGLHDGSSAPVVRIPASRVVWGLTILNGAPNPEHAVRFLQLLFGPQGVAMQRSVGPEPVSPPTVALADLHAVPAALRALVQPVRRER